MNLHAFLIKAYGEGDLSDRNISIVPGHSGAISYKPTTLSENSVLIESSLGNVVLSKDTAYEVIEVSRGGMLPRLVTELVISQKNMRRRR